MKFFELQFIELTLEVHSSQFIVVVFAPQMIEIVRKADTLTMHYALFTINYKKGVQ